MLLPRRLHCSILLAIGLTLAFVPVASARQSGPPPAAITPQPEMEQLSFLVGEWKGTGWFQRGPERHHVIQVETITPLLDGDVLLIEGRGVSAEDTSLVVHQAVAIIGFDATSGTYEMRTFLPGGRGASPAVTVGDDHMVWQIGSNVRYTISLDDSARWFEIGEFSQDGGDTWTQFFEMTLNRIDSTD